MQGKIINTVILLYDVSLYNMKKYESAMGHEQGSM